MARLRLVKDQIKEIETARDLQLATAPEQGTHLMIRLLARVMGIGIETADMLVQEVLSRDLRDRRAVARFAGLTGSPDESGKRRCEKGLAKAGCARVRHGMIQLAWASAVANCLLALRHLCAQRLALGCQLCRSALGVSQC